MTEQTSDDAEKSHDPTERRLDQARQQGDIAQSADLLAAGAYAGLALVAALWGETALLALGEVLTGLLARADSLSAAVFAGSATPVLSPWLVAVTGKLAPWFLVPAGLAIIALIAQRGPVFAPSKLAPKGSRISPVAAVRQKLGPQGLVEFAKSLAKLVVAGAMLGFYVIGNLPEIVAAATLAPGVGIAATGGLVVGLLMRVAMIAVVFGVIDYFWQWQSHRRRNMMSRKELLDEFKESEGDPVFRQQRRARAVAIATTPVRRAVAEADVVIVNPTHFAVALAWDKASGRAPVCVAKGIDEAAARIRAIAVEHGVPIQSDPPTARALHAEVAIGQEIDRRHYRAVAAAIRFAERIRDKARRQ